MSLSRTTVLRGPCLILHGSGPTKLYSQGDVEVTFETATFDIESGQFGVTDTRNESHMAKISYTPSGEFTSTTAGIYLPYLSTQPGASVFGGTDTPLAIHSLSDNRRITFHAAALTKMPDLTLAANKPIFGDCEWTAILRNDYDPQDANSLFTEASSTSQTHTYTPGDVLTLPWTAAWNAFTGLVALEGFNVSWDLALEEETSHDLGIYDMTFATLSAEITAQIAGQTVSDMVTALANQGASGIIGGSRPTYALTITSSSSHVITFNDASFMGQKLAYGVSAKRLAESTWQTNRGFSAGALVAVGSVTFP